MFPHDCCKSCGIEWKCETNPFEMNHFQRQRTFGQRLQRDKTGSHDQLHFFSISSKKRFRNQFLSTVTYQNCLSIGEVKGGLKRSKKTSWNNVFVDEVWKPDHSVFPSWGQKPHEHPSHTVSMAVACPCDVKPFSVQGLSRLRPRDVPTYPRVPPAWRG